MRAANDRLQAEVDGLRRANDEMGGQLQLERELRGEMAGALEAQRAGGGGEGAAFYNRMLEKLNRTIQRRTDEVRDARRQLAASRAAAQELRKREELLQWTRAELARTTGQLRALGEELRAEIAINSDLAARVRQQEEAISRLSGAAALSQEQVGTPGQ